MDSEELAEMDPTLAVVFRDAHELEGASRHDLRAWLRDFKEQNCGDKEVLSRDGLRHLANAVWRFNYEVCCDLERPAFVKAYFWSCVREYRAQSSARRP